MSRGVPFALAKMQFQIKSSLFNIYVAAPGVESTVVHAFVAECEI